jgi:hypothetical protein
LLLLLPPCVSTVLATGPGHVSSSGLDGVYGLHFMSLTAAVGVSAVSHCAEHRVLRMSVLEVTPLPHMQRLSNTEGPFLRKRV